MRVRTNWVFTIVCYHGSFRLPSSDQTPGMVCVCVWGGGSTVCKMHREEYMGKPVELCVQPTQSTRVLTLAVASEDHVFV